MKKRESAEQVRVRLNGHFGKAAVAGLRAALTELERSLSTEDFPSTLRVHVDINGVKAVAE